MVEVVNTPVLAGLTMPFVLAIAAVIAAQFVLARTVFGRHLVAVGANPQAAWLSGIDPRPVRFVTFLLAGLASALAAVAQSARLAAADPNAGAGLELQAIAAVVIGGTSLMGGRGSVVTTMLGVLIIAVLAAGLAQIGVQEPTTAARHRRRYRRRSDRGLLPHAAMTPRRCAVRIRTPPPHSAGLGAPGWRVDGGACRSSSLRSDSTRARPPPHRG